VKAFATDLNLAPRIVADKGLLPHRRLHATCAQNPTAAFTSGGYDRVSSADAFRRATTG